MSHILVIGGGIAGPLTAIALHDAGISSTVYEADADADATSAGAWLTIAVNGLDALRAVGLHTDVMARGFPSATIVLQSGSGKVLGEVPIGGRLADGTVTHTIKRAELCAAIHAAVVRRGIRIERGKRLADAALCDGGVVARFTDGGQARGELLVGADGVHSRTRRIIDPGAPSPRFNGLLDVGGFTPPGAVDLAPGEYRMMFGKRAFFGYTVAPSREVWWFANVPSEHALERAERAATTSEQWKDRLVELFRDDRGPASDLVRATPGRIVGANQYELASVPTWRRGPIMILGDAAHAAAPSSGQGASMAAEDAITLAMCLHDASSFDLGLAAFEASRRPRVERVVQHGAKMGSAKLAGPVGRVFRDLMMPMFLRRLVRKSGSGSMAWLFDHHLDGSTLGAARS